VLTQPNWVTLKQKTYDLWRKLYGRYDVLDNRPTAQDNPYTYYLPSEARLNALEIGDSVKLVLRSIPKSYTYDAERMWVIITAMSDDDMVGTLVNIPYDMPQLKNGEVVRFKRHHVIDIDWKEAAKEANFSDAPSKQVWDRCLVDQEVLDGTARVGLLYRETPNMGKDDDKYKDSGWRIRADVRDLTDAQYDDPNPAYIAIGKVLNKDDSWLHLIHSDVGSRFLRNPGTDKFEVTE